MEKWKEKYGRKKNEKENMENEKKNKWGTLFFLESQLWIYLDIENEERMLCIIKYRKQLLRNRRRNK